MERVKYQRFATKEDAAYHMLYLQYMLSAKRRNLNFDLEESCFVKMLQDPCIICKRFNVGVVSYSTKKFKLFYNGVDRIVNEKGYEHGNVQTLCKHCNLAKHTLGITDFENWVEALRNSK